VLKDDKRYPILRLDPNSSFPNLTIVRKPQKDGALYFGPYASAKAVRQTLNIVNKTFKLRKCKTRDFKNRVRPCLHCQMQRCLAPCCMDVDKSVYDEMVREAVLFLKGRTPDLVRKIKKEMEMAAENQAFEKAARLRDKMFALEKTVEKQVAVTVDFKDRDVLAIARTPERSLITLFVVRGGYLMGTRHFDFAETISTDSEMIGAFIRQYYETAPFTPREIFIPVFIDDNDLLEQWLKQIRGRTVTIRHPQKGKRRSVKGNRKKKTEKARLVSMATENAEKELSDRIAASMAEQALLNRLQKRLKLKNLPRHIACFDNSNISGTDPVSGMVVFENGKPKPSAYRKYRIKSVEVHDDYAYMKEVLKRRFKNGKSDAHPTDLVVVDGGKGQLNIAVAIFKELQIFDEIEIVGIAKKDEKKGEAEDKVYKPGRANPVAFGRERELLLFLQRIRDEAHRFAITFHRKRRTKRSMRSALDTIPGIGKKRKELLLKHFGSVGNIRAATIEDVRALPGITDAVAEAVKKRLYA